MRCKLACLSVHANKQMHVCVCKTLGLDMGKEGQGIGEVRGEGNGKEQGGGGWG